MDSHGLFDRLAQSNGPVNRWLIDWRPVNTKEPCMSLSFIDRQSWMETLAALAQVY
jgi:hypothetical protein